MKRFRPAVELLERRDVPTSLLSVPVPDEPIVDFPPVPAPADPVEADLSQAEFVPVESGADILRTDLPEQAFQPVPIAATVGPDVSAPWLVSVPTFRAVPDKAGMDFANSGFHGVDNQSRGVFLEAALQRIPLQPQRMMFEDSPGAGNPLGAHFW